MVSLKKWMAKVTEAIGDLTTLRTDTQTISVPALGAFTYTSIGVNPPTLGTGETLVGHRIIVFDAAHQATMRYSNGWWVNIFNTYNGTASANTAEVHWLIAKVGGVVRRLLNKLISGRRWAVC